MAGEAAPRRIGLARGAVRAGARRAPRRHDELAAALAEADLRLERWLDREGGRWFVAVPLR
jgi:hypothetical protein